MRELLRQSARELTAHSEVPLWHGRRVLALDSTVLRVPNVAECADHFGGMTSACGKFRPLARSSALLDVARDCVVDAVIGTYADDDRSLAKQHLAVLESGDLLLMDRGYPSREWLQQLADKGVSYCARISHQRWASVKSFVRGNSDDALVDLGTASQPLAARLLRHVLPNGTMLILATNVLDPQLQPRQFADLYHQRWRIEEVFKLLKARLQVENWSGYLPHTVIQDFYASLTRTNCAATLALDARPDLVNMGAPVIEKGWQIKLNRTFALKSLRHQLPKLLLALDCTAIVDKLVARLRSPTAVERTRPDRSNPRGKKDKVRLAGFHASYKAA